MIMNRIIFLLVPILFLNACKTKISNKNLKNISTLQYSRETVLQTGLKEAEDWLLENEENLDFEINEGTLNAFGYDLLYNSNQPAKALKIFELVCKIEPESSNAFDSAGEALLVMGEYEKSIEYYRKSIKLNGRAQFHQLGYLVPQEYQQTQIPKDTSELFQFRGNWENELAFVYLQGGPDLQLNIGPRDGLHLISNHNEILKIYPLQSQMLNPNVLATKPIITDSQSAIENKLSAEILHRVIEHLSNRGKKVYLIGHSFGSSICMEYMNLKNSLAEKVVLMGLDLDEDISSWANAKTGEYIRWEDGIKPYALTVFQEIPEQHPLKKDFDRIADNLASIVGHNMDKKYTQLLEDNDFKKLISVYATEDEANGIKSEEEIQFLEKKGSLVVRVNGDHHDMLNSEFMNDLYDHLTINTSLKSSY